MTMDELWRASRDANTQVETSDAIAFVLGAYVDVLAACGEGDKMHPPFDRSEIRPRVVGADNHIKVLVIPKRFFLYSITGAVVRREKMVHSTGVDATCFSPDSVHCAMRGSPVYWMRCARAQIPQG